MKTLFQVVPWDALAIAWTMKTTTTKSSGSLIELSNSNSRRLTAPKLRVIHTCMMTSRWKDLNLKNKNQASTPQSKKTLSQHTIQWSQVSIQHLKTVPLTMKNQF